MRNKKDKTVREVCSIVGGQYQQPLMGRICRKDKFYPGIEEERNDRWQKW